MKKFSLNSVNVLTLTITHFFWGYVNIIYGIQIQPYLLSILGSSPESAELLGLILSLGTLSAVIPLLLGFYAEIYGRKNLILLGQLLNVAGFIGLGFFPGEIISTVIWMILYNIGVGLYDPPLQGLIYESSPKTNQGKIYSIIYNASSIGGILAALFTQNLGDVGIQILFQTGSVLLLFTFFVNLIFLKNIIPNVKKFRISFQKFVSDPFARTTALAFIIDTFSWGLTLSIANGVFIIVFNIDSSFIGTIIFVQTLILVILQYPAGILIDRIGRIFGLLMGEFMGFIYIFTILLAFNQKGSDRALDLLLIGFGFLGISIAFWRPAVTLSFIAVDKTAVSTNFGMLAFIQRMGWVPTAAIGGFLFSRIGFEPLLFLTFFGTLIVVFLFFKLDKMAKMNPTHLDESKT